MLSNYHMPISKKAIMTVLFGIPDPELGVSLVDLGLIYDVTVHKDGVVDILMTLTTMGCPLFGMIEGEIAKAVGAVPGVTNVNIELTFEPPWSADRMSESAKIELGFL